MMVLRHHMSLEVYANIYIEATGTAAITSNIAVHDMKGTFEMYGFEVEVSVYGIVLIKLHLTALLLMILYHYHITQLTHIYVTVLLTVVFCMLVMERSLE